MRFWEAMKIVDEGGRVGRKFWGGDWQMVFYHPTAKRLVKEHIPSGYNWEYIPTVVDMVATDWEVYEPNVAME